MPTLTGYQALHRPNKAALKAGDSILIHGAAGGVGSYAVQFAKAAGILTAATCSAQNADYVATLGADHVIDYRQGNLAKAVKSWRSDGVDAIIDCVSGNTMPDALDALAPGGRLISVATLTQDGDLVRDGEAAAARGFSKIISIMEFDRIDQELAAILDLLDRKIVKTPPILRYPLNEGREALIRMKQGGVQGKIVIVA